ncbi:MAG: hypothetical protein M0Z48_13095 [Nitrospiraceae bacterium]|nr:hypothetical protein [Nitrospiraceae bacterium]
MDIRTYIGKLLERPEIRGIVRKIGRERLLPIAVLLALLVLALSLWAARGAAARRLAYDEKTEARFEEVSRQYMALRAGRDEFTRRAALSPSQGILKAVDDIFTGMGLKEKIATLKSLDTSQINGQINGLISEQAEITLKQVNLNETVNLLYRIENAPMLLTIRQAEFKNSFSAPALDIRLVLALTRKK